MDSITKYSQAIARFDRIGDSVLRDRILVNGLGCAGEAGEIADLIKKHAFHASEAYSLEKVIPRIAEELGDYFWYGTRLAAAIEVPVHVLLQLNVEKLSYRHPEGTFSLEYHQKPTRCSRCGESHRTDVRCEDVFDFPQRLAQLLETHRSRAIVLRSATSARILERNRPIMDLASNAGSRLANIATISENQHDEYTDLRGRSMQTSVDAETFKDYASGFIQDTYKKVLVMEEQLAKLRGDLQKLVLLGA